MTEEGGEWLLKKKNKTNIKNQRKYRLIKTVLGKTPAISMNKA